MLVISRKIEQGLSIGDTIEVKVLDIFATDDSGSRSSKVASIGIKAPQEVRILRRELYDTHRENIAAQQSVQGLSGAQLGALLKKRRTRPGDPAR